MSWGFRVFLCRLKAVGMGKPVGGGRALASGGTYEAILERMAMVGSVGHGWPRGAGLKGLVPGVSLDC